MILPSSHSPVGIQDHAMGAAGGEPSGGEIPMRKPGQLSPDDFPNDPGCRGQMEINRE